MPHPTPAPRPAFFDTFYSHRTIAGKLGLSVVIGHLVLVPYYMWWFSAQQNIWAGEILLPVTVGYAGAVINWMSQQSATTAPDDGVWAPFALVSWLVTGAFGAFLLALPWVYETQRAAPQNPMTPELLNNLVTYGEAMYGVLFAAIMTKFFGYKPATP